MASFLALVSALQQECGDTGAVPTSTQGQPTNIARLVSWINRAWIDIQSTHIDSWEFQRSNFQFNTIAGQGSYTALQAGIPVFTTSTLLGAWKRDSVRAYAVDLGVGSEMLLPFCDYDTFRNLYLFGTMRTVQARPVMYSIAPDKSLVLGSVPDTAYVVNGEYYKKPVGMSGDTAEPTMPSQFHNAIVYRAMMYYGGFEAASEVYQRGEAEFKKLFARLEIDQLPTPVFGAPLATL